jgi:hypothetical protein
MPDPCTVVIGAPDALPTLKERASSFHGDILIFSDAEALRALEAITARKPAVVLFERLFAATPRGAAMINRIKADRTLAASEIRVVSLDGEHDRVSPRKTDAAKAAGSPLDQRGTRRAPRFKVGGELIVKIEKRPATLVDLSIAGAQILSPSALRPSQKVRMSMEDAEATMDVSAAVAWASFEVAPSGGTRYRAGVEFVDADAMQVEAFCDRHKA